MPLKEYYRANREQSIKAARRYRDKNPERLEKINKRYWVKNNSIINVKRRLRYKIDEHYKLKYEVKEKVRVAIRQGKLERPRYCSNCQKFSLRIEAHHEDYSKPFDVVWLCRKCHKIRHRKYK